jgi:predicted CoA-binding protein
MTYQDKPAVHEAIARITAADDVHYDAVENWSNYPAASRIIESGNHSAMVELKRRTERSANGFFRAMDEATLLSAPVNPDELQRWLQSQCDAAMAKVDVDRIAANVINRFGI